MPIAVSWTRTSMSSSSRIVCCSRPSSLRQRGRPVHSSSIERKQLISFGLIMAIAFLVLAWWLDVVWLYVVSGVFLLLAIVTPRALAPLYRPWMRLAEALGWFNTRVLLALIFYLVVTPIGLVMRLFGRSPVAAEERNGSFWAAPPKHSWGDKHFEKQF
ncbi:MAG TPA: SxtJ family membrane protein [Thermoanaerobaculia bacterium]|nr:SxtJ family membrane protein [Thermoanaerobaculia bacterium]